MLNYENYMKMCIDVARRGEGFVSPNPLVGAVIVNEVGDIVSTGWHEKFGEAHAEVNAINRAEIDDFSECTLIVNLEPCSHYGKTPPCSDLIIEKNFKRLVVGMKDPNPICNGAGINKCKDAGIDVIVGVLEEECRSLNEIFIKNQEEKKPFVALKTATTLDGKIATKTGSSKWITSDESRDFVQSLRNRYDAILTTGKTVLIDNPFFTCRKEGGRNPVRIILDKTFETNFDMNVYEQNDAKVFLVVYENLVLSKEIPNNVEIIKCPLVNSHLDLNFLIGKLFDLGVYSILVEAGGVFSGAIFKENLVDKLYHFIAPKIIGDKNAKNWVEGFDISGISDCIEFSFSSNKKIGKDILIEGYFKNKL